jgi:hypothetical protein
MTPMGAHSAHPVRQKAAGQAFVAARRKSKVWPGRSGSLPKRAPIYLPLMADPLILYSTNSWLAYVIAERFYDGKHYVWCSPDFDARSVAALEQVTPPSSSPAEIYRALHEDVRRGERHGSKIRDNMTGILRGAAAKRSAGLITDDDHSDIVSIAPLGSCLEFQLPFATTLCVVRRAAPFGTLASFARSPSAGAKQLNL